jgi:hypothetical protein
MCFVLYAGTSRPMVRKEWRNDAPDLFVQALTERESRIGAHFSKPEVQYIGSTTHCGCAFPNVMFQNGGWPWIENKNEDELDRQRKATEQHNREGLFALLREIDESSVELYGVWDGNFDSPPAVREEIRLEVILDPSFRLKEQVFYTVRLA